MKTRKKFDKYKVVGILAIAQVVLLILKALGIISWPWLSIFTPLIFHALVLIAVLITLLCLPNDPGEE